MNTEMDSEMDVNASETGSFNDFMGDMEQSVMKMIKETAKAPADMSEACSAFSHAVDWNENWIRGLIGAHVVLLTIVLLTRKNADIQTLIFLFISMLVVMSERINGICAARWDQFSTQNYFDEHGIFAGIMFAAPLLFIGFVQLVSYSTSVMVHRVNCLISFV